MEIYTCEGCHGTFIELEQGLCQVCRNKRNNPRKAAEQMSHTIQQFYFDSGKRQVQSHGAERIGQAMFNHLVLVRPDLSEQIRGSDTDPFYCTDMQDPCFQRFYDFLEQNWDIDPKSGPPISEEQLRDAADAKNICQEDLDTNWQDIKLAEDWDREARRRTLEDDYPGGSSSGMEPNRRR